jgi:cellulose synthase/poly-beta-1,6-N-acetylglucosamine synthase-like glycosyltransferase
MTVALFLICLLLFAYPFVIYPLVIAVLPRWRSAAEGGETPAPPSVALVICAFNEQNVIRAKVENCLALDYPDDKLRIVVVSDGSTDATASIVREYAAAGVELVDQQTRRGKITNLNEVVPRLESDIVVLSDANVMYHKDVLRNLTAPFRDQEVGCVSGKVVLVKTADALNSATASYYSVEWSLQERASEVYAMPGADGAMYALRRKLFRSCPNDTVIEDFVIPMSIVRQGKRVVFAPDAIGWEQGPASLAEEFRRKVRIAAGAAQALTRGNGWPGKAPAQFWFLFVSHKLLRWLSPFIGLGALLLAVALADQMFPRLVVAGFALLGLLAAVRALTGWSHPLFTAPFYFLFGQVALAVGLLKGVTGRQSVLWAKANR